MSILLVLATAAATPTCLDRLSREAYHIVTAYDRAHDSDADSASFSCALGLTASEVQSDLQRIVHVASLPGCFGLRDVLFFPFTIAHRNRVAEVKEAGVCRYSHQIKLTLLNSQRRMIGHNLQLAGWRGAFFRDGDIWLNTAKSRHGRAVLKLASIQASEPFPPRARTTRQAPPKVTL